MVQAARSGKQNIIDASVASGASKETEIKLTNVARASLEELIQDYRDFLRVRGLKEWQRDHPHAQRLSELVRTPGANYRTVQRAVEHTDPSVSANAILGLIKVTSYLLKRQLGQLEQAFITEGGLREHMTRARLQQRERSAGTPKGPTALKHTSFGPFGPFGPFRPFEADPHAPSGEYNCQSLCGNALGRTRDG